MTLATESASKTAASGGDLASLFRPRSIAVAGASPDDRNIGRTWLEVLRKHDFAGPLYPVNPRYSDILGLPCYPDLTDIPGPVDYVISCLPAHLAPTLVEACIAKGVRLLHFFTARMAESGDSRRIEFEAQLGRRAREGGLRILGPNCMGLYHPAHGISFAFHFPRESGCVGYFAQSGGNTNELIVKAGRIGIYFTQAVSFGNALDINECDLLEHFSHDPQTRVIAIYIEGVKDGRRFLELLKETTPRKPVVVMKGGRSAAGTRAVGSHTAALAGDMAVWTALFRQTGVIQVYSLDEMVDLLQAFVLLPAPNGRRVSVAVGSGGPSVQSADDCELAGLLVQPLSAQLQERIREVVPHHHGELMLRNPIDSSAFGNRDALPHILRPLIASDETDLMIQHVMVQALGRAGEKHMLMQGLDLLIDIHKEFPEKPVAAVIGTSDSTDEWRWKDLMDQVARCTAAGIPVYPHVKRAAQALSRFCHYHEFLASRKVE